MRDVNTAKVFEDLDLKDDRLELVASRTFASVCFRLKPKHERGSSVICLQGQLQNDTQLKF